MSATPTTREQPSVHPSLAGMPETITEHEQALLLVQVIEANIPHEDRWRELKEFCAYRENLEEARRYRPLELEGERQKVVRQYRCAYAQTSGYLNGDRRNVPGKSGFASALSKTEPQKAHARPETFAVPVVGLRSESTAEGVPAAAGTKATTAESAKHIDAAPSPLDVAPAVSVALGTVTDTSAQAPIETPTPTVAPVIIPSPTEATKKAILNAAPNVFQLVRMSTGAAAVIFEFVRRWKLYVELGFSTMREYAAQQLGVSGDNYREYARAGKAMWDDLPELASRVIEYLCGVGQTGPGAIAPPVGLPSVPSVSVLRVLPRALRQTDPSERAALIARVEAGECTYDELRTKGPIPTETQPASPVAPANDDLADGEKGDGLQTDQVDPRAPAIFSNLPELNGMLKMARTAAEAAKTIVDIWVNDGGPDVDPIVPRVRVIADTFAKLASEIDDTIIPRTVCSACKGSDDTCSACRGMGWLPRVHLRSRPAKRRVKRAKAKRQKSSTLGSKKKSRKSATK
jgi:hypothetical protein